MLKLAQRSTTSAPTPPSGASEALAANTARPQFLRLRDLSVTARLRRRRRDANTSPTQDSIHLVKKCTKPDRKEFARIASATMIGFLIMGFVGFFVKLVHIPINNILMT